MADDIRSQLAALKALRAEGRSASRSSSSRLGSMLGPTDDGGSSYSEPGSEPSPPPKKQSPKPLSMLAAEAKKGGHIGRGKENRLSFEAWIAKIDRVTEFVGNGLPYKTQIVAAEGVANLLRNFLLEGVDPPLSGFTIGLHANRLSLKPGGEAAGARPISDSDDRRLSGHGLAALARHVVVNKPKKARRGYRPAGNGKPGVPGVFAKGYDPCTISFDSEQVDRNAYVLEHGKIWKPPDKVRKALMAKAMEGGFKPSEGSTTGYWELPPRPFSHILTGPEAQRIVRKTAEAAIMGTLKPQMAAVKERYVDAMEHAHEIDGLEEILSSGGGVEDEMVDLLSMRGSGSRRRR